MTRAEIERVKGTIIHLRGLRLPCWYVVLSDGLLDMPEAEVRKIISKASSYIVQAQVRAGLPQYWLRVMESTKGVHANLVFPASPAIMDRFASGQFGVFAQGDGIQKIGPLSKDWTKVSDYLVKERTPQAERAVGRFLGPRIKGSHKLGEGGGDRVQLSPALRVDAIAAGKIEPWRRTTSRNLPRPDGPPRKAIAVREVPAPRAPVTITVPVQPEQLSLFTDLPRSPLLFEDGAAIREIRLQLGKTQNWLATQLGISDRSHIANIERGHDHLSPPRRRLLRHIVETQRLPT